ncbi:MAG: hypothetical protein RL616_2463 [Verrucomicrobiota bacterium]
MIRTIPWLKRWGQWPQRFVAPLCVCLVTVVGLVDYWTGYETFFFIFYLAAVYLAVWFVGGSFGILISALSVAAWVSSNIEAGARYSSYFVPVWNASIMFVFYLVVVRLLVKIKNFNRELEQRVQLRTESLAKEIRERMRLQKELLETSERERRRIGHELHDGLCQQLTGAALAGQLVSQKLADKSAPESVETSRLVRLIEAAIEQTRSLSRGLSPVELQPDRLLENFQELAARSSAQFKVACRFEGDAATPLPDAAVATHLFHIAEEAVANAVRHGRAQLINICLDASENELALTITDDGAGLLANFREAGGMGLRVMAYRADLIGATFEIEPLSTRGTRIACTLPVLAPVNDEHGG